MERVSVLVQVDSPGTKVQLQVPPCPEEPSAHWQEKFASVLRPLGDRPNTFRCVLFGSLVEVACHLWQHQVLWMHIKADGKDVAEHAERHVAVSFSEVVEPSADFTAGRYQNCVTLEEEALDGSGQVSVVLILEVIRDEYGLPPASIAPSFQEVFLLHLQLGNGGAALVAQAARKGPLGQGLCVRCCGVEQPLQESMDHTLVLVSTWGEVPKALLDLDVCIQAPVENDVVDLPLDLSELIQAAAQDRGPDSISAHVRSERLPGQAEGISFKASIRSLHWSSHQNRIEPGRSKDAEHLWTEGLATGPRTWRISLEMRSLRLTTTTANAFVVYAYELLQQPRPFRTNPPVLARKSNTVYLPHGFAAYTLTATVDELAARLEDTLRVEVWHRDVYTKDSILGLTEFGLGAVFDHPIQYSASMPTMVNGFRVLDQVCPVLGTAHPSPTKIGLLRVLLFLEDLGPAGGSTKAQLPAQAPAAPLVIPPASNLRASTDSAPLPPPAMPAMPLRDSTPVDSRITASGRNYQEDATSAALEGLQALRSSPEYSKAFQLELWKRAEEEKFRAQLKEEETSMRESLEEEYRHRELQRSKEFRQRQNDMKDLEAKVRKKFQELQQREAAIVSEENRVTAMIEDAKRRTERTIQEHDDASKRRAAEADHLLKLERDKVHFLEAKLANMEEELASARQRAKDVEEEVEERRKRIQEMPQMKLQQELQEMQLQLLDSERRSEALAASRDHFRRKVEELCRRLLRSPPPAQATGMPVHGPTQDVYESPPGSSDCAQTGMQEMQQALHKMQDHLADLAREWGSPSASSVAPPVQGPSSASHSVQQVHGSLAMDVAAKNSPSALVASVADGGAHLEWLRNQKEELLQSGLYTEGDPVLVALDARISEAFSVGVH